MSMLFPQRIKRVRALHDGSLIDVENGCEARFSTDENGDLWVRKREDLMGSQPLVAEAVGWLLCVALKAPVTDAAVLMEPIKDRSWLSRAVLNVIHWDSSRAFYVKNLDGLGRLIAVDAILWNTDRHRKNLLMRPAPNASDLEVIGIDMDHALVGYPDDFAKTEIEAPPVDNIARGIPVDLIEPGARDAARLAVNLSDEEIRGYVLESCEIGREPKSDLLRKGLTKRCQNAEAIVERYLHTIRGVR